MRRSTGETASPVLEAHAVKWLHRAPRPEASLTGDPRPAATGADDEADGMDAILESEYFDHH